MNQRIKDICEYAEYDPKKNKFRCNMASSTTDDCKNKVMHNWNNFFCTKFEITGRLYEDNVEENKKDKREDSKKYKA